MTDQKVYFNHHRAESVIQSVFNSRLGYPVEMFDSVNDGVFAFARLSSFDVSKIDMQEVAAAIARETGHTVECIANTDWSFTAESDEEATYIAFSNAPDEYKNAPWRNQIKAVSPENAPSQQDFDKVAKAYAVLTSAFLGQTSQVRLLEYARKPDNAEIDAAKIFAANILSLKVNLKVEDREVIEAVLDFNFDQAFALANTNNTPTDLEIAPSVPSPK